jgi:hypothetical protein
MPLIGPLTKRLARAAWDFAGELLVDGLRFAYGEVVFGEMLLAIELGTG